MEDLKLHGGWASPFSFRVTCALKLKGIPYQFHEEDLSNKSSFLLDFNPVHKRIPVLVHGGKPICESMVILEYLDETWPHNPLLPKDPYDRAMARFWAKFADDKGISIWIMFRSTGKELEKAKADTEEMLKTIEQHALGDGKFYGGDSIGMVDLAIGGIIFWLEVLQEIVGVTLLNSDTFPRLHTWRNNFMEVCSIIEIIPVRDKLFIVFKQIRERLLKLS